MEFTLSLLLELSLKTRALEYVLYFFLQKAQFSLLLIYNSNLQGTLLPFQDWFS